MTGHGIPRDEWECRFSERIKAKAALDDPDIFQAELQSWPVNESDWLTESPEDAADDNLGYWTNDEPA